MKLTEELAEIFGMFAADGCLQDNYICIWGNIFEDKDYYNNFVCPLFSKVFKKEIVAHEKKSNSVYGFYVCDKNIIQIFREAGFIRNKTYSVKVPQFILDSNDTRIYSAFIRGFTDCDGCISFMKRKGKYCEFKRKFNTYPRISIAVTSFKVIEDISFMLDKLNIKHTKYSQKSKKANEKDVYLIYVRGPERVEDWMKKIGFSNPSKQIKYEIWKKFGTCPPKVSLEQKKLILQNKINPFTLYEISAPDRI
jgi:intein/homing endonuclease